MADIPESRNLIQLEEVRYGAAGTESLMRRFGAQTNFLNKRHIEVRGLFINGVYNAVVPNLDIDGGIIFEFPVEIVNVYIKNRVAGTSGTTELDLKWKPQASGTWASMFSTTPKITSTAAAYQMVGVGQSATGFTAPILSKTQFDAYDMIRLDLMQAMAGTPTGCAIIIHYRPR